MSFDEHKRLHSERWQVVCIRPGRKENPPVTSVISDAREITEVQPLDPPHSAVEAFSGVLRLDYLSCVLTIASTVLVGRRCWEGWALATINSVVICVIAIRTAQFGFIPANVFCIAVSAINMRSWRKTEDEEV